MDNNYKDSRYWAVKFNQQSRSKVMVIVYLWLALVFTVVANTDVGNWIDLGLTSLILVLACSGTFAAAKERKQNKKEVVSYLSNVPKEHDYILGKYRGFVEGWDSYKNTVKKGTG